MFNHNNRVAKVAQLFKRVDKPLVVALVQANAWLVKDVKHVDKLRTNLCGQPDSLAFTARERARLAVERKIIKPHFKQKIDAALQFFYYFVRYLLLLGLEMLLNMVEPFFQFDNVHIGYLRNVLVPDTIR